MNKPDPIRRISAAELARLSADASAAPRQRAHLNIHPSLDAPVQRLFIAVEPATYMRPHRHPEPHKWEFLAVIRGQLDLLTFDVNGTVSSRTVLSPTATVAVEIPAGIWHCYVCTQPGTQVVEVKEGAYLPTRPEDFAPWSPPESSAEAVSYLAALRSAT